MNNQQNGFLGVSLLVVVFVVIVFSVAGYFVTLLHKDIPSRSSQSPDNVASGLICPSKIVQSFIKQKGFEPVVTCRVEKIRVDDKNSYTLYLTVGEGMDCESGCIYRYYTGILDFVSNEIHDLGSEPSIYELFAFLGGKYGGKYGELCSNFDFNNAKLPPHEKFITQMNGKYYWAYSFYNLNLAPIKDSQQHCVFNGTLITTKVQNHYVQEADSSNLNVEIVTN